MISLIILILSTGLIIIILNKILNNKLLAVKKCFEDIQASYDGLTKENLKLQSHNDDLKRQLDETIALYEVTKDICKYLDEDKVFSVFKEKITKYVRVSDCKFLNKDADLLNYNDYAIKPIEVDKTIVGYLAGNLIDGADKDKFNILSHQFELAVKRAILYKKVQEMAITDSLTGVFSRKYWLERFRQEIERSRKFKHQFSFLMVDIDNFKMFNDRYGHLVGDAILKEVAARIKRQIRQVDLFCRYGGEEFAVILIETDKSEAVIAAERILKTVNSEYLRIYDEDLKITISIGVSLFPQDSEDTAGLIERADKALYSAKQSGKNKVCVHARQ